jgi:hypothetical protein
VKVSVDIEYSDETKTDDHTPDVLKVPLEHLKFLLMIVPKRTKVAGNVTEPGEEVNFPGAKAEGTTEADKTAIDGDHFGVIVSACSLAICEGQGDGGRKSVKLVGTT